MNKVLLSLLVGLLAPIVFYIGVEPFWVHERASIMGVVAGSLAVALYLAFYQFWLVPKESHGFAAKWPTLTAITAPLFFIVAWKYARVAFSEGPVGPVFGDAGMDRLLVPLLIAGCVGSCAGAVLAGRVVRPVASLKFCRRSLLIGAALLVAVVLVVAGGVIPPVKADLSPHATSQSAATGLWVMAILNLLAATPLVFIAIWPTGRSSRPLLGTLALLAFLLACVFTGPAFGFWGHGPAMQTASILLFFCAAAEFLAAVLVSTAAFLLGEPPAHQRRLAAGLRRVTAAATAGK